MKVYGISLVQNNCSEIKLCDITVVEDFFKRDCKKYGINEKILQDSKNDDSLMMKLMPYLTINNEKASFTTAGEYENFINKHQELEVVQIFEGILH